MAVRYPSPAALKGQPAPSEWRWFAVLVTCAVVFGILIAALLAERSRRNMRDVLAQEVTALSWAVRADHVQDITGEDDRRYQRLRDQIILARAVYPYCRGLGLVLARTDGSLFLLMESRDEAPAPAPDETVARLFEDGELQFERLRDHGIARIAMPLTHPYTDAIVAALLFDADLGEWDRRIMRELAPAGIYTAAIIAMASLLLAVRIRRSKDHAAPNWRAEVLFVAGCCLATTGLFTHAARQIENYNRMDAFRRIGGGQGSLLQQSLFRISDTYLEGIARFFESSNFVDAGEYSDYVQLLLNRPYAHTWLWVPEVAPGDLDAFTVAVRNAGTDHYSVWRRDDGMNRIPVHDGGELHYPVCYAEPSFHRDALLGYDMSSDPLYRRTIAAARETGLPAATDPAPRLAGASTSATFVAVFRPVFNRDGSGRLSGLATAILVTDTLLHRAMSRNLVTTDPFTLGAMVQIEADGRTRPFSSSSITGDPGSWFGAALLDHRSYSHRETVMVPAFAFGKTYALALRPGPGFDTAYPRQIARFAAVSGLVATGLITLIASLLANQRRHLEQKVRKRKDELEVSEESYRRLFNSIRQAIYIIDGDMKLIDVNDGAVATYGYAREELIGLPADVLAAEGRNTHIDIPGTFQRIWQGVPVQTEFWGRRKNGEVFPKDVWLYKGTYFGRDVVIAIGNDITERKRAEEEHERLRAQLLQSQKMESVGRLACGVAHDFNNMLQAIIGNAALARKEIEMGRSALPFLIEIHQSAERSAALTRQLLAFASKQTIQPRLLNLNHTVAGMLNMLRLLVGENIRVEWIPGDDLWPVKADPNQIDQVIANLVVNARDAIDQHGTITIRTGNFVCNRDTCREICTECIPGHYVKITVADDGCGMDEEVQRHIFEPFFTTKDPSRGTGLGLATVFGIVNQNRGVISVRSAPGTGTRVHVMLPRDHGEAQDEPQAPLLTYTGGTETILLVEDEATVLRLGVTALQSLGYKVLAAGTPEEAIAVARTHGPQIHLLITDVILPGMNGRDLVAMICAITPPISVLFMSGYTADVINDGGVLDETVNFLQKPFTISELAAKVREILDRRASTG